MNKSIEQDQFPFSHEYILKLKMEVKGKQAKRIKKEVDKLVKNYIKKFKKEKITYNVFNDEIGIECFGKKLKLKKGPPLKY